MHWELGPPRHIEGTRSLWQPDPQTRESSGPNRAWVSQIFVFKNTFTIFYLYTAIQSFTVRLGIKNVLPVQFLKSNFLLIKEYRKKSDTVSTKILGRTVFNIDNNKCFLSITMISEWSCDRED